MGSNAAHRRRCARSVLDLARRFETGCLTRAAPAAGVTRAGRRARRRSTTTGRGPDSPDDGGTPMETRAPDIHRDGATGYAPRDDPRPRPRARRRDWGAEAARMADHVARR